MNPDKIFQECLNDFFVKGEFFNPWFRQHGKSHVFVFKKNLRVTNIQYAELISLIREDIEKGPINYNIQFLSVADFCETIKRLFSTFDVDLENFDEKNKTYHLIEECYSSIIKHIVVVDALYGSCVVFLPYHINLDVQKICALSGYIHSAGNNIFIRRISKTSKKFIFDSLKNYIIKNYPNSTSKIPFTLYAHEDFTPFDRDEGKDFFTHGLDDIKFYAEKLYVQSTPLAEVISEMEQDEYFIEVLDIAKAGDYHRNIKGNNENSFWLIVDKTVLENSTYPSKDIFFICYDQKFINENPYHLFDENKPGWIDHTTIPHTLIGSMLNIAIPIARKNKTASEKIAILDPFVGSGTTYLELLKYNDIDFSGSDLNNLTSIVAEDNLHFFNLSYPELLRTSLMLYCWESSVNDERKHDKENRLITFKMNELKHELAELEQNMSEGKKGHRILENSQRHEIERQASKIYDRVIEFFIDIVDNGILAKNNLSLTEVMFIEKLESFNERLLFYLCLKAYKRNLQAFERNSKNWATAFTREISDLRLQVNNLAKLRKRAITSSDNNNSLIEYLGNYSYGCSINPNIFSELKKSNETKNRIKAMVDVIKKLESSLEEQIRYDIIITDPPYGFNTEEITEIFAKLYHKMISLMIQCLRPNGQLLLCLPEISNTGRQIHYFTQKEIVIHQVLISATENGKNLVLPFNILPRPTWLYKAPYYWESEKALRRAILHFVIK